MEREPCAASEADPAAPALFAWGANSYGQLGLGHKEDVLLPQQLNDFCKPECVRRITGGGGHSAIVTDGGGLFVCGLNKDGQLGLGHTEDVLYFTLCKSLLGCPIQQVACGWDFTIILTENGQVLSCGSNSFGQLGVPHGPRRCVVPQAIELLREKIVCVAAGLRHALAATVSGIVFQWGTGLASSGRWSSLRQTLPLFLTAKEPSRVTGLENSKAICVLAGSDHSASLTDAGELYVWGSNKHGQLAAQAAFLPVPQKIEAHCFQNEKVTAIWSGWTHLVAQTETGKVFTWGRADYGQLGRKLESHDSWKLEKQDSSFPCSRPQNSPPSSLHCLTGATEVSCGSEHNLAVIGRHVNRRIQWQGRNLKKRNNFPQKKRWGVSLLGLERAWHVWGWHRSQRLGPEACAASAVSIRTPCGMWRWPLPGPLSAASISCTGPRSQGHLLSPGCHGGHQISGRHGQKEKLEGKTIRNFSPKPF
ncbi:secretion-regulating guanine nucleotide exchange factor isoform X2 [Marmota monax]|uniref:secretion-regulating guanine nucleotide exchange factor isoform X2 n=1 Tax=Marmota monax TaxID=9995 RepID=UPI001EB06350|nr:secretion-regulating guanine nucleotide exchange factor isoform X2 [Marmota monax]